MKVPNLSIEIDTGGAFDLCLFMDHVNETGFLFEIYCEIGDTLMMLPDLGDLSFVNGWFQDLGYLLAKRMVGERRKEKVEDETEEYRQRWWGSPNVWYERVGGPPKKLRDSRAWETRGRLGGRGRGRGRGV